MTNEIFSINEADLTTVFTAKRFKLGDVYSQQTSTGIKVYRFVHLLASDGAIAVGDLLINKGVDPYRVITSTTAITETGVGISEQVVASVAVEQYFFVVVRGNVVVKAASLATVGLAAVGNATAGTVTTHPTSTTATVSDSMVCVVVESGGLATVYANFA